MNKSLIMRMMSARSQIMMMINETGRQYDLPAFVLEEIVADALGELRQASKVELIKELEMQNEQSVQSDNVEK